MATNTKILGVNLDADKQVVYSLQGIYGIGHTTASNILKKLKVPETVKPKDIEEETFNKIRAEIEGGGYVVEGDLRQKLYRDVARLKSIKVYRGQRHKAGLPVRGQNTRKNARTRKGRVKIAVGGLNKPVAKK